MDGDEIRMQLHKLLLEIQRERQQHLERMRHFENCISELVSGRSYKAMGREWRAPNGAAPISEANRNRTGRRVTK
jgi:hypothetical protein